MSDKKCIPRSSNSRIMVAYRKIDAGPSTTNFLSIDVI